MSGFASIGQVIDAELQGRSRNYVYRKTPSQVTTVGIWFDMAMSPGMPTPKYWFDAAPLTAKAITQSADGGFYHGPNVSPSEKFLRSILVYGSSTSTGHGCPVTLLLCDYLLYYPTIDDGLTDPQIMDNTVTLPRYTNGAGVQMIAVTTGARVGGQTFTVTYTNQDGTAGRVTPVLTQNASTLLGTLTNTDRARASGAGPFIPLADGDTGVRSVQSVQMNGADVGIFSIVLVRPLAMTTLREVNVSTAGTTGVPYEKDLLMYDNVLPKIEDNAFLNYLALPTASIATTIFTGSLKVIWN